MPTISDRLNEVLGELNQNAPWLAKQVVVTRSAAYQWLNGNTKGMKPDNLVSAARALRVRVEWLATGELPKYPRREAEPGPAPELSSTPIVGNTQGGPDKHWFEMGYPAGYGEEVVDTPAKNTACYGLRVRGGSMFPRMQDGDAVTVDPTADAMSGDDVVVRMLDGEVLVKRLVYERKGEVALDSIAVNEPRLTRRREDIEFMHLVIGIHPARAVKKRHE